MWKELDEEAKEKYIEEAGIDKARYIKEMASYKPPMSEEEEPEPDTDSKPQKKRRKKDPSAPKGQKSAYIFFCNDVRPRLVEENKELKMTQLSKLMGKEWKALDD